LTHIKQIALAFAFECNQQATRHVIRECTCFSLLLISGVPDSLVRLISCALDFVRLIFCAPYP